MKPKAGWSAWTVTYNRQGLSFVGRSAIATTFTLGLSVPTILAIWR